MAGSRRIEDVDVTSTDVGIGRHTDTIADVGSPSVRTARALPESGTCIGQYELIRQFGRGGMGAVYLARDTRLGRRVAIKFLHSASAELNARFILEARATARCNHENIVVIHEVGEHQGNPFMVLEYLQGSPLSALVGRGRRLPPGRAVALMVPVVRALDTAHKHDIVHRDLKPDNIFVTDSGTVKVLDFGIAKLVRAVPSDALGQLRGRRENHQNSEIVGRAGGMPAMQPDRAQLPGELGISTRQGAIMGTLPYMSPEQWGAGAVDHRTDLWAVGIILFQMVAGRHPLAPRAGWELMVTGFLDQPMPGVREVWPDVPDDLAQVIDSCLCKDKERRMSSARALLDALEPMLPGRHTGQLRADQSPYPGLSAFQESDASRFFGRSREIGAAVTRLHSQPLMGVVGPSGAGKSSFVRAGVIPALKRSGELWASMVVRPGQTPVMALARLVAPLFGRSSATVAGDFEALQAMRQRLCTEPGYLGSVLRSRARQSGRHIVLFVDQFEELYTLVEDAGERQAFTACLAGVADDATAPLRVIVSIRSDFLDRVADDERFMTELGQSLFFLSPPGRDGLREALSQPAQMAGYGFDSEAVVDDMLDHLEHASGGLPLLQFAASKLWELRDGERRLLTEDSYRDIGGVAGALASHADAVLNELSPGQQPQVRVLLLRLVTPERTRALVPLGELEELSRQPGELRRLADHLVHARLLVVQTSGDIGAQRGSQQTSQQTSIELVHESLIHSWPRLRRWLDESQEDALYLHELRSAARQWQMRGYPGGLLWRGEAADEARRFVRRYRGELSEVQRAYLRAVLELAARSVRRRRYAMVGLIALLSVLVVAAAVVLVVIREAQQTATVQAEEAERQLVRARLAESRARVERENAVQARERVVEVNGQLSGKNAELIAAVAAAEKARRDAEEARARAESDRRTARRDRARALQNERAAELAEARERALNERLQHLLAEERARVRELERQGTSHAIKDVEID
ncbi:MAG: protein kinase [Proteobacteria bacterium]|nr:protein kinase [Pseudomonadota bacterium]